jgi:hypothetical protein
MMLSPSLEIGHLFIDAEFVLKKLCGREFRSIFLETETEAIARRASQAKRTAADSPPSPRLTPFGLA